jgi:hypothetical protein
MAQRPKPGPAKCDACGKPGKLRKNADGWRLCFTCFHKAAK